MTDGHNRKISSRNVVDIIDIHKSISRKHISSRDVRNRRIVGLILVFLCIGIFFFLGYTIASLQIPIWAKSIIFAMLAVLGLIPGYIAALLLR